MEALLRRLALVGDAYLRGGGSVEHRRGLFRPRPFLPVSVGGNDWVMGRRSSRPHYPDGDSTGCRD